MLDALRNKRKLARTKLNLAVPESDLQLALDDKEQFVLIVVLVPDKLTRELGQLDVSLKNFDFEP